MPNDQSMKPKKQIIKVVLVEDDPYYNRLLNKYVQTICGGSFYPELLFEIKSFLSAHECIEQLEDDLNILVLDYFLFNKEEEDVLSGIDVLKAVKKHSPDCKIIVVSALKSPSKILRLHQEGIDAYIDKNINSKNRIGAILQSMLDEIKEQRA